MVGPNEKLRVLRRLPEVVFDEEMHGYNKHQVDKVLDRLAPLADEVDVLMERLGEAERRAAAAEARLLEQGGPAPTPESVAEVAPPSPPADFDETLSKTLLLAQRTADATVKEAEEAAAQLRAEAEADASKKREGAVGEAERVRSEAEVERADVAAQAVRDANGLVDEARRTLMEKVTAAEAELADAHESTRADLIAQIAELRRTRDALATDVDHFEGHLAARRETIRTALAEMTAVVDDPERLRTSMPPTPVEVADLTPADVADINIDVPSIDSIGVGVVADATADAETSDDIVWADESETFDADSDLHAGEATEAVPVIDVDADAATDDEYGDGAARPAWAEAVPEADDVAVEPPSGDPFLDELRRATNGDDEGDDDQALANFLNEEGEDDKGGWFGRRR